MRSSQVWRAATTAAILYHEFVCILPRKDMIYLLYTNTLKQHPRPKQESGLFISRYIPLHSLSPGWLCSMKSLLAYTV
jgi:hypothetical protein